LALTDFWLIPEQLNGKRFSDVDDIKSSAKKKCFEQWPKRWEHCKELQRNYFEKFSLTHSLMELSPS
jgi:hypothetical protein